MNVRLFGVLAAMSAMGLVACSSDETGASGTGGGTGTGGGAGTGGDAATTAAGTGGSDATTASSTGSGGADEGPPCAAVCADDAGCDADPPDPGDECGGCVQDEADQGTDSECAVAGALGDCCQSVPDCSDYVSCVLADDPDVVCEEDFPEGAGRASACVLASCGECGTAE